MIGTNIFFYTLSRQEAAACAKRYNTQEESHSYITETGIIIILNKRAYVIIKKAKWRKTKIIYFYMMLTKNVIYFRHIHSHTRTQCPCWWAHEIYCGMQWVEDSRLLASISRQSAAWLPLSVWPSTEKSWHSKSSPEAIPGTF